MKKLLILSIALLTIVACTDSQKEKIADTVDDVSGISQVRESERLKTKIDSINNMEVQRIDDMNEEF